VTAVLAIGGTDSSGGAGLARDVATLTRFGVEALCAVTAVTAQTDREVSAVELLPPGLVRAQISAALAGGRAAAVKVGMLGRGEIVEAVAGALRRCDLPLVLDPVLAATSGGALLDAAGRVALAALLLPRATLLTPNIPEAAALLGAAPASSDEEIIGQGRALCALGAAAVLMKGGHARHAPQAVDWLVTRAGSVRSFAAPRIAAERRGTGCALAAAVAAGLAARLPLEAACERAKAYVTELLQQRG